MAEILINTKNAYFYYCFYGVQLSIIVASMFYLALNVKTEETRKHLLIYAVTGMAVAMFPGTIYFATHYWMSMSEYWKIYELVPGMILTAFVMVDLVAETAGKKKKWIVCLIFVIIMGAAINFDFSLEGFGITENFYRTDADIVALAEMLEENGLDGVYLMTPEDVKSKLVEYDTDTKILGVISNQDFEDPINAEAISYEILNVKFEEAKSLGITCIILKSEYNYENVMKEYGYTLTANNDDYYVYIQ